jgi:hypothetical protein
MVTWVRYLTEAEYAVTTLDQTTVLGNQAVLKSARAEETLAIYGRKVVDYSRPDNGSSVASYCELLCALIFVCLLAATNRCLDCLPGQPCYRHYVRCLVW